MEREFLIALATHALRKNIYEYSGELFSQRQGTAMGSPFAVAFANIFMYKIESPLVTSWLDSGRLLLYRRLIDDIFTVFPSASLAAEFWNAFNDLHPYIRVTGATSNQSIQMLDLTIFKGTQFARNSTFDTRLYQKPLHKYAYIPFCSYHSTASKLSWLNAELRRMIRNNSDFDTYLRDRDLFCQRLIARRYPVSLIRNACHKVQYLMRHTYLQPPRRNVSNTRRPLLIAKHTPQVKALRIPSVLNKHWDAFSTSGDYDWAEDSRPLTAQRGTENLYGILKRLLPC